MVIIDTCQFFRSRHRAMSLSRGAKVFSRKLSDTLFSFFECRTLIKYKVRRGNNNESRWSTEGGTDKEQMTVCRMRFVRFSLSRRYILHLPCLSLCVLSPSLDRPQRLLMHLLLSLFLSSHLDNLSSRRAGPRVHRDGTQTHVCLPDAERRLSISVRRKRYLRISFIIIL